MKAKRLIALILSVVLLFSVVPVFEMTAGAVDAVAQDADDEFVPEYGGNKWIKADNYIVNLTKAFSDLASSVMYSAIGLFWTFLIPPVSIPIAIVGGSTVSVAYARYLKALLGYKVG